LAFDRGKTFARGAARQGCRKKILPKGLEIFLAALGMALTGEGV